MAPYGKTIGLVLALALAVALADGLWVNDRDPPNLDWNGPFLITTKRSYNSQEFGFSSVTWFAVKPGHCVAPGCMAALPMASGATWIRRLAGTLVSLVHLIHGFQEQKGG